MRDAKVIRQRKTPPHATTWASSYRLNNGIVRFDYDVGDLYRLVHGRIVGVGY